MFIYKALKLQLQVASILNKSYALYYVIILLGLTRKLQALAYNNIFFKYYAHFYS